MTTLVTVDKARERVRTLVEQWCRARAARRQPIGDRLRHEAYGMIPVAALEELPELRHYRYTLLADHAMARGTSGPERPPAKGDL